MRYNNSFILIVLISVIFGALFAIFTDNSKINQKPIGRNNLKKKNATLETTNITKITNITNTNKSDNLHVVSNNNLNTNKNRSESHNKKKIVFTKSGYFEFKTNIRQNNFSLVHNELIPKTSNEKSLWLSSPIEKNFWFKGKIKALQNNKSKEILYQYYNDDENLLLLSAVKKGNICSFYVTNDYKIKIGRMKCCNFIGTNYKINQYINKFYAEINYKLNIFGLNGPMKLKILVRNENTNK